MDKILDIQFKWTDEQWDKYHGSTVSISLDFLDHLTDAVHLIRKGSRLDDDQRKQWQETLERCHSILLKEVKKIE